MWFLISNIFWLGLWLFGLGLLTIYIMRWWPGDQFLPVRLFNYIMPWLFVGLIPALLVAILARRGWLASVIAIPTLLIALNYAPLFLTQSQRSLSRHLPL